MNLLSAGTWEVIIIFGENTNCLPHTSEQSLQMAVAMY